MIGLDGLEPTIVEPMLAAGELPNLARLRARGRVLAGRDDLARPDAGGLVDVRDRDEPRRPRHLRLPPPRPADLPARPRPEPLRAEERLPAPEGRQPPARDAGLGPPLGDAGVGSTVLRCPCTYPPDPIRGRMLSGMGVPDLRGGLGTADLLHDRPRTPTPGESENVVRVSPDGDGTIATHLIGPRNPKDRDDLRLDLAIRPRPGGAVGSIIRSAGDAAASWRSARGSGATGSGSSSRPGCSRRSGGSSGSTWSGSARTSSSTPRRSTSTPRPRSFPISHPAEYAGELAEELGPVPHDGDGRGPRRAEQRADRRGGVPRPVRRPPGDEREAMMLHELERFDEGLFYCLFDTPDRVQHLFWRFREPDHPANRGEPPAPELARVIEDQYRRGDAVVGKALRVRRRRDAGDRPQRPRLRQLPARRPPEHLAPRARPAGPARRASSPARRPATCSARSTGRGRGPTRSAWAGSTSTSRAARAEGIVEPDEAEALKAEIARALDGLRDPEREAGGRSAGVLPREELYSRPVRRRGARPARPLRRGLPRLLGIVDGRACPAGRSRTTRRSGAAITSSTPPWSPASCS